MELERWLKDLFARIDADGVRGIHDLLHEDVAWRYGSFPPATGRDSFAATWGQMAPAIAGLEHELIEWWRVEDRILCRGEVTYRLHDGGAARFPFLNVFGMDGERISEYLIYIDASPVFGPPPLPEA